MGNVWQAVLQQFPVPSVSEMKFPFSRRRDSLTNCSDMRHIPAWEPYGSARRGAEPV